MYAIRSYYAVTKIMQVIIDRGIVVTAGKNREQSGVGRRQINLEINSDLGVVLGLEIQDARYQGVLTGIDGRVLHSFEGIAKVDSDALVITSYSIHYTKLYEKAATASSPLTLMWHSPYAWSIPWRRSRRNNFV